MEQEKLLRAMFAYMDNECQGVEETSNFSWGVLWTINKLRKAGMFENNNVDEREIYRQICEERNKHLYR